MAKTTSLPSSKDWKVRNGYPSSFWEVAWLFPLLISARLLFPSSLSRWTSSGDSQLTSPSPGLCFAWPLTPSPATSLQPRFCMSSQVQCCHHQTHTQLFTTTLQNFLELSIQFICLGSGIGFCFIHL